MYHFWPGGLQDGARPLASDQAHYSEHLKTFLAHFESQKGVEAEIPPIVTYCHPVNAGNEGP
jgi:hypothetical protein